MNNDIVIKQGDILSKVQNSRETSLLTQENSSDNQKIQDQNVAPSVSASQSLVNAKIGLQQQLNDNETQKKESEDAAKAIQSLVENNQNLFSVQNRQLNFDIVDDSGDVVVKVVDRDTDEVIRQIPSEEFLQVANKINDLLDELSSTKGILFDSKV
jgi:flagellar protein FlaG